MKIPIIDRLGGIIRSTKIFGKPQHFTTYHWCKNCNVMIESRHWIRHLKSRRHVKDSVGTGMIGSRDSRELVSFSRALPLKGSPKNPKRSDKILQSRGEGGARFPPTQRASQGRMKLAPSLQDHTSIRDLEI